ncbi:MAG: hypothetical protein HOP18_20690 [Deltaproteobacteria bacterium]|nr:hypothetical protein [Deltaproteobacteria bacterium]
MTERRYGFRFNVIEAGMLVVCVVFSSVLIFLSGIYVGKGVEAHRTVEQRDALRMPIALTTDPPASGSTTPLAWKLPKDKPTESQPSHLGVDEEKEPSKTEAPLAVAAKEKPRPVKEAPPAKIEERATASLKERPRSVKETSSETNEDRATASTKANARPVKELSSGAREKARTNTEEAREPVVRAARAQPRPNEKLSDSTTLASLPAQKPTGGSKKWKVQVEATSREETAREIADSLRAQGYSPTVSRVQKEGAVLYRVRVGKFATQDEAVAAIGRFRRDGKFSQAYPVSE